MLYCIWFDHNLQRNKFEKLLHCKLHLTNHLHLLGYLSVASVHEWTIIFIYASVPRAKDSTAYRLDIRPKRCNEFLIFRLILFLQKKILEKHQIMQWNLISIYHK